MDPMSNEMAMRLAAVFPNSRMTAVTISEWSKELHGLREDQAEAVLELIKAMHDRPPSIREIRRCIVIVKQRVTGFGPHDDGINSPCVKCKQPVKNDPNAQSRYDRDTDTWINAHIECPEVDRGEAEGSGDGGAEAPAPGDTFADSY